MKRIAIGLLATAALAGCTKVEERLACDRACLIALTESYVAGLEGNSTEGIPFSDEVVIVENLDRIAAGEGLWADITGAGTAFSVVVPDEANQTAGWIGMVEREGKPTIVALRLKLDPAGSIVEAEHLHAEVNAESPFGGPSPLDHLHTPRAGLLADVPEADRKSAEELIALGATYYDALDDNDGTLMPFAADCARYENGIETAGPGESRGNFGDPNASPVARDCAGQLTSNTFAYIDRIDNRRVFAADPVTGLVMGLSHFRHPMDFEPYPVTAIDGTVVMRAKDEGMFADLGPFDLPAAHIFKVGADGKVHEIEAMGFLAPLNSPTGWEGTASAPETE
ncbi:MAG TPA: hypothetical protein VLA37_03640 [Sphingomonadaceae bacterium]|nr:hypothetical protein [Sphingomonadaceae bacterium]